MGGIAPGRTVGDVYSQAAWDAIGQDREGNRFTRSLLTGANDVEICQDYRSRNHRAGASAHVSRIQVSIGILKADVIGNIGDHCAIAGVARENRVGRWVGNNGRTIKTPSGNDW